MTKKILAELDTTDEEAPPNGTHPTDAASLRGKIKGKKRAEKLVHVDDWDADVLVCSLDGKQRRDFEALPRNEKTGAFHDKWHAAFLIMSWTTLHPQTREPVFTAEDEAWVVKEHPNTVDKLAGQAITLSFMALSQQEEAAKNSGATPTSSTTDA